MAIDTSGPKSRRAILIGAAGAAAASVATAVGRANPVSAADGDPVLVGKTHSATTKTEIDTTGGATAFHGKSDSGAGVFGSSTTGYGVDAYSNSGTGVRARSKVGVALNASNSAADRPAILGESIGLSTGVQGWSGTGAAPDPVAGTGVYGSSTADLSFGVFGSATNYGVYGLTVSTSSGIAGVGVFGGASSTGSAATYGVWGESVSSKGVGVLGYAPATSGRTYGVRGEIYSPTGKGAVVGHSNAATGSAPGVLGTSGSSNGIAVMGTATSGRGGVFSGRKAPLRLVPSTAASHPSSGLKGDLFVDKSARLWLCTKGGNSATWKRVQLV